MGKVSGNWLTGAHSGSACKHENIYTKVNKITGACYSVKLCHPVTEFNQKQYGFQDAFKDISSALSSWIQTEKAKTTLSEDYKKVLKMLKGQNKYSQLRGLMMSKGMFEVDEDTGAVTVDVDARNDYKASAEKLIYAKAEKYTITSNPQPSNAGRVDGSGTYIAGTEITLTAVPNSGYVFNKWSDGVTTASRTIVVTADLEVNANFKLDE